MSPKKIIVARRRGDLAICRRMVNAGTSMEHWCGEPLVMFLTPSPISSMPYETLLVLRCPEHIDSATGVLPGEQRETWRW